MGDADVVGHLQRLIVFDLDGTLVNSRQDLTDSANALIVERGGRPLPSDAVAKMVGEGAAVLVQRALAAARLAPDEGAVRRFLELYDGRLLDTTRPYPGILQILEELSREASVAVLTNKPIAPTRTLLEALGMAPFIVTTLGGDGAFPRKPDPAALWHLMAVHQTHAGQTVLVGDSRIDFETARAAGTAMCLARYGFGYDVFPVSALTGNEGLADHPSQIPGIVRALLGRG
jgi:phosphoglycolate phosphatase